jgi:hypothetical protein
MKKKIFLKFVLLAGDIFLMYSVLFLTLAIRYNDFSFLPGPQTRLFVFSFSFIFVFWTVFLYLLDFYDVSPFRKIFDFLYNFFAFILLAIAVSMVYFYLNQDSLISPKSFLVSNVLLL